MAPPHRPPPCPFFTVSRQQQPPPAPQPPPLCSSSPARKMRGSRKLAAMASPLPHLPPSTPCLLSPWRSPTESQAGAAVPVPPTSRPPASSWCRSSSAVKASSSIPLLRQQHGSPALLHHRGAAATSRRRRPHRASPAPPPSPTPPTTAPAAPAAGHLVSLGKSPSMDLASSNSTGRPSAPSCRPSLHLLVPGQCSLKCSSRAARRGTSLSMPKVQPRHSPCVRKFSPSMDNVGDSGHASNGT
ncbi:hypothetical protein U9M48_005178 [Paspalum notatum var. saurae]|uniref:Uncharacterized protein n=1 Tax=Paspalum notatum var. saurae TaxID=547442 RepID=A0AAQ3PPL4_PASNO